MFARQMLIYEEQAAITKVTVQVFLLLRCNLCFVQYHLYSTVSPAVEFTLLCLL